MFLIFGFLGLCFWVWIFYSNFGLFFHYWVLGFFLFFGFWVLFSVIFVLPLLIYYFCSSIKVVSFFGIVQRVYSLFTNSTKRWKVLLDNVPDLTVKSLCNTRWESQIKSVKAIIFQTPQIRLALFHLYKFYDDAKSKSKAESFASSLESFEFLLSMVIGMKFYLLLTW